MLGDKVITAKVLKDSKETLENLNKYADFFDKGVEIYNFTNKKLQQRNSYSYILGNKMIIGSGKTKKELAISNLIPILNIFKVIGKEKLDGVKITQEFLNTSDITNKLKEKFTDLCKDGGFVRLLSKDALSEVFSKSAFSSLFNDKIKSFNKIITTFNEINKIKDKFADGAITKGNITNLEKVIKGLKEEKVQTIFADRVITEAVLTGENPDKLVKVIEGLKEEKVQTIFADRVITEEFLEKEGNLGKLAKVIEDLKEENVQKIFVAGAITEAVLTGENLPNLLKVVEGLEKDEVKEKFAAGVIKAEVLTPENLDKLAVLFDNKDALSKISVGAIKSIKDLQSILDILVKEDKSINENMVHWLNDGTITEKVLNEKQILKNLKTLAQIGSEDNCKDLIERGAITNDSLKILEAGEKEYNNFNIFVNILDSTQKDGKIHENLIKAGFNKEFFSSNSDIDSEGLEGIAGNLKNNGAEILNKISSEVHLAEYDFTSILTLIGNLNQDELYKKCADNVFDNPSVLPTINNTIENNKASLKKLGDRAINKNTIKILTKPNTYKDLFELLNSLKKTAQVYLVKI